MTARRHPFFTSARGRLLSFNLLMGVVTLLVSGVAVFGFHHASQLQEPVQFTPCVERTILSNCQR